MGPDTVFTTSSLCLWLHFTGCASFLKKNIFHDKQQFCYAIWRRNLQCRPAAVQLRLHRNMAKPHEEKVVARRSPRRRSRSPLSAILHWTAARTSFQQSVASVHLWSFQVDRRWPSIQFDLGASAGRRSLLMRRNSLRPEARLQLSI